ncbi:MAG: TMEM175 family protein [Paracoccaceae bacterium]
MTKGRIEAFSDGVIAIIITIMVLELKVPEGHDLSMLKPLLPIFLSYVLSFANVGIYWNNHHQMFHAVKHVGGWVLWANLHLLFWLSLMPFATGMMGENHFAPITVALYAADLLMCAIAYTLLVIALLAEHGPDSDFAKALGSDRKGKVSLACYALAMPLAFVQPVLALCLIAVVACIWIVPDRRFARAVEHG